MSNSEDINAGFEELKSCTYNEIHRLIKNNQESVKKDLALESKLEKFKPSKHRKAYRIENNFRKRCYAR
ncbi:MAG: hypothetical protein ACYDG2_11330 [Ruminiclostridium sp.]